MAGHYGHAPVPADLTYCIVNTNGREHLLACLAAIARTHPEGLEPELLVLDNASNDGSAAAARAWAQSITCHSERRGREAARSRGISSRQIGPVWHCKT